MRDKRSVEDYRAHLLGARGVVIDLLGLFQEYGIHATWATVGFLFLESRDALLRCAPALRPEYKNPQLSSYAEFENVGANEAEDPFHFAPSLVRAIASSPGQEVGTHTLSHYFCLEPGQDINTFRADLAAAVTVAAAQGLRLDSIVFPRNQCNEAYLEVCRELGVLAYRGNDAAWVHRPVSEDEESLLRRAVRLVDNYLPISGYNLQCLPAQNRGRRDPPCNIPSSRFLRPYSRRFRFFEPLRFRRIAQSMTRAARSDLCYHLYWHPHNFGADPAPNLAFLRRILDHWAWLRDTYGMRSLNMREACTVAQQARK